MRSTLRLAAVVFCLGYVGNQDSTASEPSSTYSRLEAKFPVDRTSVVVKKCAVDGEDFTKATRSIKVSAGTMVELNGLVGPGKMGVTGIIPKWTRREGEPVVPLAHVGKSDEQSFFFVLGVYGSEVSKDKGTILHDLVDNRQSALVGKDKLPPGEPQQPDLTEFRCRFAAPDRAGQYVIDLRLTANRNNSGEFVVLPIWRCELEVE